MTRNNKMWQKEAAKDKIELEWNWRNKTREMKNIIFPSFSHSSFYFYRLLPCALYAVIAV